MKRSLQAGNRALGAVLLALGVHVALSAEQNRDYLIPAESIKLTATSAPGLPPGVQSAVVSGNVAQPGVYVLRNRFPPNVTLAPHTHGKKWRIYTVLEGEIRFGFGPTIDESRMVRLGPGSVVTTFEKPHYFLTGPAGATLNVVADGPFTTDFVKQ
jgi:redox-sensitive bicupin YhaK (pirin superfamily)